MNNMVDAGQYFTINRARRYGKTATFQSVILASVHDIKNIKQKLRAELDHKTNSPCKVI